MHIWDNNPLLDRSLNEKNAEIIKIGPGYLTNASNRDDRHFANAFRISIEDKLGINIPQGPIRPDIYMAKEEINKPPLVDSPYWIINAGEKGDWTAKTYPFYRWQKVVNLLPKIKFVQIGQVGGKHSHQKLQGENVVDFLGKTQDSKTGIRDLIKLFYRAEGSIGLVSFHMHLAAAFNLPCVVVAGAREPSRFTHYPGHRYLSTDGCLPCTVDKKGFPTACWHCDLEKTCESIITNNIDSEIIRYPKCVGIIDPEQIVSAINSYYRGGRLVRDVPRIPILPNPISVKSEAPQPIEIRAKEDPKKFGYEWGGSSITERDWLFIKDFIKKNNIETVLEFGSGLSTLLISDLVEKIVTVDDQKESINHIKSQMGDNVEIIKWDGTYENFLKEKLINDGFDLVFVDGPFGGENREHSIRLSSELGAYVIIHDAGRKAEEKWQAKYLLNKFIKIADGGHRCRLWQYKDLKFVNKEDEKLDDPFKRIFGIKSVKNEGNDFSKEFKNTIKEITGKPKKIFRMVFNGRGEGGAESSTTWIMNRVLELGWTVEYVSPKGPSGTFRKKGHKDIKCYDDLDIIKEPCDVMLLYTNDWVWDFKLDALASLFDASKASKKVMAVNYRLGDIGNIGWTKGWNAYIFLNNSLRTEFKGRVPTSSTYILPPPVDLSKFFEIFENRDYSGNLKLIRHSSQGDTKYPRNFNEIVKEIQNRFNSAQLHLMPSPSFLDKKTSHQNGGIVWEHRRNQPAVWDFLRLGNVFWYYLPKGYLDMGPKVIMEAMASGLPVIADNHSGAKDRLSGLAGKVKAGGFLCGTIDDHIIAMEKLIDPDLRMRMGADAHIIAKEKFVPEHWIKAILD
jgi:ADP-heptose:LPS heptosyltransferase